MKEKLLSILYALLSVFILLGIVYLLPEILLGVMLLYISLAIFFIGFLTVLTISSIPTYIFARIKAYNVNQKIMNVRVRVKYDTDESKNK